MRVVRRHLRSGIAAWLVCHALAFTTLVPRECCAAHGHEPRVAASAPAGEAVPCHDAASTTPVAGAHCDMPASDGAACPMHAAPAAPVTCALSGSCAAPAAALAAIVLQAAVLVPPVVHAPHLVLLAVSRPPDASRRSLAVSLDSPPPRL